MSSYISAFRAWGIALAVLVAIESAYWAIARPTPLERTNFRPYAVQELYMLSPKRSFTYQKAQLDMTDARVITAGDSSGMFSLIPDVVARHFEYGRVVNLNCCAPQGWHGYLAVLEYALKHGPSIEAAVIYATPEGFIRESRWREGPRRIGFAGKNFLMGNYIKRDLVDIWHHFALPTMALRRDLIQTIVYKGRISPRDHQNPGKQLNVYEIQNRAGYQTESDPKTKMASGPFKSPVDQKFDWSVLEERSLLEVAMEEFVDMAESYGVIPVLAWAPSPRERGATSDPVIRELARVRALFPELVVLFELPETYPPNFFGGPSHIQNGFAIDVSMRLGRALAQLLDGTPGDSWIDLERLANAGTRRLDVVSAVRHDLCFGDTDLTDLFATSCQDRRSCSVDLGRASDLAGRKPEKNIRRADGRKVACRVHDYVEIRCGDGPVRPLRQTAQDSIESFDLTCEPLREWDSVTMPRGIKVTRADLHVTCDSRPENHYKLFAGLCDGHRGCSVTPAEIPFARPSSGEACRPRLELEWRCDAERETRHRSLEDALSAGAELNISCPPAG